MNGENVKKVYVVNLDNTRILLITGVFISFCVISFFIGLRWQGNVPAAQMNVAALEIPPETNSENLLSSNESVKDSRVMILPEEDTKMFTQRENTVKEDPFLAEPPGEKTDKSAPARKNEKRSPVKDKGSRKSEASSDKKYYTIQIAAFAQEKEAKSYQNLLKKKGIDARVDQGKLHYYVRVGKSTEKDSLQAQLRKINRTLKLQAIVVQRKLS